jgi:hypothetical protein
VASTLMERGAVENVAAEFGDLWNEFPSYLTPEVNKLREAFYQRVKARGADVMAEVEQARKEIAELRARKGELIHAHQSNQPRASAETAAREEAQLMAEVTRNPKQPHAIVKMCADYGVTLALNAEGSIVGWPAGRLPMLVRLYIKANCEELKSFLLPEILA